MEGRPLRILLVEDNPDHAELVLRGLEDHHVGNDLVHVPDGEEALDYLFRRGRYGDPGLSPRPDLVLLDLRLPKVDGLEVLRQIKEAPGEVGRLPVVILTTSQGETDLARAYDQAAKGKGAERHAQIKNASIEYLLRELSAHGSQVDEATTRELWEVDLELNAQGLEWWLDHGA